MDSNQDCAPSKGDVRPLDDPAILYDTLRPAGDPAIERGTCGYTNAQNTIIQGTGILPICVDLVLFEINSGKMSVRKLLAVAPKFDYLRYSACARFMYINLTKYRLSRYSYAFFKPQEK